MASALYEIMCHHGYPRTIIHDRGKEFVNELVKEMLVDLAGMLQRGGAPYHPQTQGSNERRHAMIRDLIKEQLHTYSTGWLDALPTVQMKMNIKITRRHNSTPFAVYYGRSHNVFNTDVESSETWEERLDKLEKHVHPHIKKVSDNYNDQSEIAYNKKHRGRMISYKKGDEVKMLNINSNGTKLDNTYKGPYIIYERVGDKHYNLVDVNSGEVDNIINLYPVPVEQIAHWRRADIIHNLTDSAAEFVKILDHITDHNGIIKYGVLWKDGSRSDEYDHRFTDPSVLTRYHARVRKAEAANQKKASNALNASKRRKTTSKAAKRRKN
jgi:hypothetical protein